MQTLYTMNLERHAQIHPRVLLHQFDGAIDAGNAANLATEQLLTTLPGKAVATFNIDALIDYRSRRPSISYDHGKFLEATHPSLVLELLRDDNGEEFLFLHGDEPDYRWDELSNAIIHLARSLGVTTAMGMAGIPMPVPHTRPTQVYEHGQHVPDDPNHPKTFGYMEFPAAYGNYLELRLGQAGFDSRGVSASVPHYLLRDDFPQSASALLRAIAKSINLALPVGDLEANSITNLNAIETEVANRPEVAALVQALEKQYDKSLDSVLSPPPDLSLQNADLNDTDLDTLTAQLEAFLESNNSSNGPNHLGNEPNQGPNNSDSGPNNSGNATNQGPSRDQPET